MAEPKSVSARLLKIVTENIGVSQSEVGMGTRFNEDLGCDSLDMIEIVMGIEEEFDIEIPDEDFERVQTFEQAVAYVVGKVKG